MLLALVFFFIFIHHKQINYLFHRHTEFEKKIMVDALANVTPKSFEKSINRNILGSNSSMDDPVLSPRLLCVNGHSLLVWGTEIM